MQGLVEGLGIAPDLMEEELDAVLDGQFSEQSERIPNRRECESIYRQIALRLHPDRGGTMDEPEA